MCSTILRMTLLRRQNHHHLAALKLRFSFDLGDHRRLELHLVKQTHPEFLMRHFAATEAQGDLHLVALFKEPVHSAHFDVIIMVINARTHLDFLDFDDLLLFARFRRLLLRLVFQAAKINDLADRRLGIGNDFYQIETSLFGHRQGVESVDNTHILAFGINQLDFGNADIAIGFRAILDGGGRCSEGTANGRRLLILLERAMCAGRPRCQDLMRFARTFPAPIAALRPLQALSAMARASNQAASGQPMTDYLDVNGEKLACLKREGEGCGLVWLGGWRSDMHGSKAEYLNSIAAREGFPFLRFDYSGHGLSTGHWSEGTITKWCAESRAVFRHAAPNECILVGSSMGAWITLRMLAELQRAGEGARVKGIVLIAPAPDFTMDLIEPNLTDGDRNDLAAKGWFEEKSDYLPEPNRWSQAFLDDGRANRVLDGIIHTHCPVHILQGQKDEDVPLAHALKLVTHLPADRVTLTLVPDGDHRLSRPQDLALLEKTVLEMLKSVKAR
jgi:pimeloyl-ACP methyl ester carboxylesterase